MITYHELMDGVGKFVDGIGVLVVLAGAALACARSLRWREREAGGADTSPTFRQNLGRAILLGLEFLIAGDIIRTVVVSPTVENVSILGLIVVIRTFLSVALQLEIEGRWPWQRA